MNDRTRTESRTLKLDTLGAGFMDGPIECDGYDEVSVQATDAGGSTAWSTGAMELKGWVGPSWGHAKRDGEGLVAFGTAATFTSSAPHRGAMDATGFNRLDMEVTTAQAAVVLKVNVYLRQRQ